MKAYCPKCKKDVEARYEGATLYCKECGAWAYNPEIGGMPPCDHPVVSK